MSSTLRAAVWGSRRSPTINSSAWLAENSGRFRSAPRTHAPSSLNRFTRCPPINPPAPQTNIRFLIRLPSAMVYRLDLIVLPRILQTRMEICRITEDECIACHNSVHFGPEQAFESLRWSIDDRFVFVEAGIQEHRN